MPKNSQTDTLAFINTKLDIPDKPILPPKPAVGGSNVNTVKSTVLRVVDDEEVNPKEHIANQDDLTKAVVGKITLSGDSIGDESFDMNKSSKGTKGSDVIERGGATIKNVPLTFVEEMPEFPGGEQKLQEYLKAHIEYPNAAIDAVRQGKVLVRFVVNEDGTITNVEARNTIGFGLEEEAMRVVRAMPRWTPGKNNGIAVKVWFQVPIFFKLN
jgi:protein TonB